MRNINLPEEISENSILIHIGPHKTGTTALQLALKRYQTSLTTSDNRFQYVTAGNRENANIAVMALRQVSSDHNFDSYPYSIIYWDKFVNEVVNSQALRVAISAEAFADLENEKINLMSRQLSGKAIHIMLGLRSISELLPSQWQQRVQSGNETRSFSHWLNDVLTEWRDQRFESGFWYRHHYKVLINRWAKEFSSASFTAVVLDRSDRGRLFEVTERLLGLVPNALQRRDVIKNRSLTFEEVESLRGMYSILETRGLGYLSRHLRQMLSPSDLIKRHRKPLSSEGSIVIPKKYVNEIEDIQHSLVDAVKQLKVGVVGNLDGLATVPVVSGNDDLSIKDVPVDLVGWVAAGIVDGSGLAKGWVPPIRNPKHPITLPDIWLHRATGRQLLRELIRRVSTRLHKKK